VHRAVSRYGLVETGPMSSADVLALRTRARGRVDVELGTRRAKAATLLLLALNLGRGASCSAQAVTTYWPTAHSLATPLPGTRAEGDPTAFSTGMGCVREGA
jgi:hypothetical protein